MDDAVVMFDADPFSRRSVNFSISTGGSFSSYMSLELEVECGNLSPRPEHEGVRD